MSDQQSPPPPPSFQLPPMVAGFLGPDGAQALEMFGRMIGEWAGGMLAELTRVRCAVESIDDRLQTLEALAGSSSGALGQLPDEFGPQKIGDVQPPDEFPNVQLGSHVDPDVDPDGV